MSDAIVIGGGGFTILSASAMRKALLDCANAYCGECGAGCDMRFDTSGGLVKRVARGDSAAILASSHDSLLGLAASSIAAPPRVVGASRLALGVRRGERAPDISSVDRFREAVLGARRVSRGDPAGGGTAGGYFAKLFDSLDLADPTRDKTVLRVGGYNVMQAVADGEADFGLTQSTEITAEGVEIGAWLPDEIQLVTRYAVALGARARDDAAARGFFDFVTGPRGAALFAQAGFAPA